MNKQELLDLLRICNADPTAIEAVELAYELGYRAGVDSTDSLMLHLKQEQEKNK